MKTRYNLVAMVMMSLSIILLSCTSSSAKTSEVRSVEQNFYGIILNGNANVFLSQGDFNSVRLEGMNINTGEITTYVNNGALVINAGDLRNVNVYVTMSDISLIQINGAGVIRSLTPLSSDMLLLKISGSGIISADVRTLSVGMIINGIGKIYARGVTGDSFVKIKGNGQVINMNLDTLRQTASVETVSNAESGSGHKSRRALSLHQ